MIYFILTASICVNVLTLACLISFNRQADRNLRELLALLESQPHEHLP
jgi:hypothetical protein